MPDPTNSAAPPPAPSPFTLPRSAATWSTLGISLFLLSLALTFRETKPIPSPPPPEAARTLAAAGNAGGTVPAGGLVIPASDHVGPTSPGAGASTGSNAEGMPAVAAAPQPPTDNRPAFFISIAGFAVMLMCLGKRSVGRFAGVLITERNVMSLSRFQTVLWTCLILSGLATIAFAQIKSGDLQLDLRVPSELWALMGISTASLVGTPLILANKNATDAASPGAGAGQPSVVFANRSPHQAAFGDLVEGDERGNATTVDLSKVQMFAFTIVALVIYLAALLDVLANTTARAALPAPSNGFLALLGISHAGYLTYKAVNHSAPANASAPKPEPAPAPVPAPAPAPADATAATGEGGAEGSS